MSTMIADNKEVIFLRRKVEREKAARAEAEHLLEMKSRELYNLNEQLLKSNQSLDKVIAKRTEELEQAKTVAKELKQAQATAETAAIQLSKSLDHLKLIIHASKATTWNWDLEDNTLSFSGTIDNLRPYTSDDIISYDNFINIIHPEDRSSIEKAFSDHLSEGGDIDIECRFYKKQGSCRWFHLVGQVEHDLQGKALRLVGSFVDIHDRKESEEIIEKMAHFDSLTNIPNRSFFNQYILDTIESSRQSKTRFALLTIDLNDFKIINDRYGHQVGDALLKHVATILKSHTKGYDLVARLGGDEFALLLNNLTLNSNLDGLCKTLIRSCDSPIELSGNHLSAKISIGIAYYPDDGDNIESLLHCSDMAMYSAKQNKVSGSTFANYQRDLDAENTRKRSLRDEIEIAIEKSQFCLAYQPCVEISNGVCRSCEALLRWPQIPIGVNIQDVIDVAEESGLILPLSKLIIDQACQFIHTLETKRMPQKIAVNLSAVQFQYQDIFEVFSVAINKYSINPHHLQIEVTENLFLGNMDSAISTLRKMGSIGVETYIDDFGTGYSSLKYLQMLPIDWVKIDKTFIDGLGVNNENLQIIQAVIKMTHSMGRRVVAEGVETPNQYQLLTDIGCDVIQGYCISKALPDTECLEWIQNHPVFYCSG